MTIQEIGLLLIEQSGRNDFHGDDLEWAWWMRDVATAARAGLVERVKGLATLVGKDI
jgi:hypothetical protein